MMTMTSNKHELAIAFAKAETHMGKAKEKLAGHDVDAAHYHMMKAQWALEDYLTVEEEDDGE